MNRRFLNEQEAKEELISLTSQNYNETSICPIYEQKCKKQSCVSFMEGSVYSFYLQAEKTYELLQPLCLITLSKAVKE